MAKLGPVPWAFIVLVCDRHLDGTGSPKDGMGRTAAGDRVARGFRPAAGHQCQSHGGRGLRDDLVVRLPGGESSSSLSSGSAILPRAWDTR